MRRRRFGISPLVAGVLTAGMLIPSPVAATLPEDALLPDLAWHPSPTSVSNVAHAATVGCGSAR